MAKRALLVGCNYPGTDAELRGCVNDVRSIHNLLKTYYGFEDAHIRTLIDTDAAGEKPTGANIKRHLTELVAASQPGDVLVFHFSGHGTQITDNVGDEADNKDECICPTDMNLINDDDLRAILHNLPDGVKFTMISDCCHSGSMLDHPVQQISGDKDPNALPGASNLDPSQLIGMFMGLRRDMPESVEFKNRALPEPIYCKVFSQITGRDMQPGNVRGMLDKTFGADASAMAMKAAGVIQQYAERMSQGTGNQAKAAGLVSKMLKSCFSQSATVPSSAPGVAGPGVNMGGAAGGAPAVAYVPAPGLNADKGVLITGCQSHETSADACPSGDATQAFGALTNAITTAVRAVREQTPDAHISYKQLVQDVRTILLQAKYKQNPCLECSDINVNQAFIC